MTAARITTDLKPPETQANCYACMQAVSIRGMQTHEIFAEMDAAPRFSKKALAGL